MAKKKTGQSEESLTVPPPQPPRRPARRPASAPPPELSAGPDGASAHELLVAADDTNTAKAEYKPTYDEIAEAAYHRYLQRGGHHGQDFDDWVEAERTLKRRSS